MDCGPPGSSVHGILQARRLEWAAVPSSREEDQTQGPRDQTQISDISCTGRQVLYHCTTWEARPELKARLGHRFGGSEFKFLSLTVGLVQ